jgi:hypothetical protein
MHPGKVVKQTKAGAMDDNAVARMKRAKARKAAMLKMAGGN